MTTYLTARQVKERYSISEMTLYNWIRSGKMNFPKPLKIRNRNYFDKAKIEEFDDQTKIGKAS